MSKINILIIITILMITNKFSYGQLNVNSSVSQIQKLDSLTYSVTQDTIKNKNGLNQIDTTNNKLEFDQTDENNSKELLLPQNISWMESALWGQNGLVRKFGIAGELNNDQREKELGWRRTMLTIHQTSGLITWGLMAGTVVAGQMLIDGKLKTKDVHKNLVGLTTLSYTLTGLMSILTPPPITRNNEFSTTTFHKTIAWAHLIGMIITPILADQIKEYKGYGKAAHFHQISGYVTFTLFTSSMLSMILFR